MKDEGWIKVSDRGKVGEGERWYQGLMEETGWRGKGGGYRERRGLPYSPERSKSGHHSCSLYRAKIDQSHRCNDIHYITMRSQCKSTTHKETQSWQQRCWEERRSRGIGTRCASYSYRQWRDRWRWGVCGDGGSWSLAVSWGLHLPHSLPHGR